MFSPQSVIRNSSSFLVLRRGVSVAPLQAAVVMAGLLLGGAIPHSLFFHQGRKRKQALNRGRGSLSGTCRVQKGACFCSAARRGENRVSVFVQRLVAAKIGCLFLSSGSSRPKSGACFCSADRRGENRGCEFVQRVVAAKIGGANLFSGSSRPKSGVRIHSAGRRGQNRGCEFVQRLVADKIGGANSFSGSSRPKSGVRICSADRRGQNQGSVFVQRIVAAKIAGGRLCRDLNHITMKSEQKTAR